MFRALFRKNYVYSDIISSSKGTRILSGNYKSSLTSFSFKIFLKYMYFQVWVYTHECRYPQRPEEGVISPKAGGPGSSEVPDMGVGN